MDKKIISEDSVKVILNNILNEEASKVRRDEYAKVQFKIEELSNSLNDTLREFRKLQDSVPGGLKGVMSNKLNMMLGDLNNSQKLLAQLKDKVKIHKRAAFAQQIAEKKK